MKRRPRRTRTGTSRPHWSARLEDRVNQLLQTRLRERGWRVRIEPYTGYGNQHEVRLLARTLLARSEDDVAEPVLASDVGSGSEPYEPMRSVRGWRNFLNVAAMWSRVRVELGGETFELSADRSGCLDVVVPIALAPGWHQATVTSVDGDVASCPVLVVGDEVRLGLVSDIDDTVMMTWIPRPALAAWNALVLHENARRVVPGMPVLYNEILHRHPDAPVIYLSTGTWNVAPALRRFLVAHGFPAGPLLLTDWGPTNTGLFRSGREHKEVNLRQLVKMFPNIAWLLVGDDGQHDPEIYGDLARERPDRVLAIVLRQLTAPEHVLSRGVTGPNDRVPAGLNAVPVVRGHDGAALRSRLSDAHVA